MGIEIGRSKYVLKEYSACKKSLTLYLFVPISVETCRKTLGLVAIREISCRKKIRWCGIHGWDWSEGLTMDSKRGLLMAEAISE